MYFGPDEVVEGGMDVEEKKNVVNDVMNFFQEWWVNFQRGNLPEIQEAILVEVTQQQPSSKKRPALTRDEEEELVERKRTRVTQPVVRERRALPYIGDVTLAERRAAFWRVFSGENVNTLHNNQNDIFTQNPYAPVTWRSVDMIKAAESSHLLVKDVNKNEFDMRYTKLTATGEQVASLSRPELFVLKPVQPELFKEILYGENTLLMKIIPLYDEAGRTLDAKLLDAIYNEIKASFFLNELVYGYSNVLSVHFMMIVDWFQTTRLKLRLYTSPHFNHKYHQITIAERATSNIEEFLKANPSLAVLRVAIFQILHSLEIAWETNRFTHNDLHLGNVLVKRIDTEDSPFRDKTLLYKRASEKDWYVLPESDLRQHIVKIIDFGFARLFAPSAENHTQFNVGRHHVHDRLIGINLESSGRPLTAANRQIDMRNLFLSLCAMPASYWHALGPRESKQFFDFVENQVVNFNEINALISSIPAHSPYIEIKRAREQLLDHRITASNLHSVAGAWHLISITYTHRFDSVGPNVSNVLSTDFFDTLRRAPSTEYVTPAKRPQNELVVSFITSLREVRAVVPLASSPLVAHCEVCGEQASHFVTESGTKKRVAFCGALCADFMYHYNSKTVFR
jgi:serine/threonine protein kinase